MIDTLKYTPTLINTVLLYDLLSLPAKDLAIITASFLTLNIK